MLTSQRRQIDFEIDNPTKGLIEGQWVAVKSLELSGLGKWLTRLRDAYEVLLDKQRAYEFKEDYHKRMEKENGRK